VKEPSVTAEGERGTQFAASDPQETCGCME